MNTIDAKRAYLVNGRFYIEQEDGSLRPGNDHAPRAMSEEEIEAAANSDPDALPLDPAEWTQAVRTAHKRYIHIGVDHDVLDWFKAQGKGYQTRINAVLRRYMEARRQAR